MTGRDARFVPEGTRKYNIQAIHAKHHEIKRLILLGLGNKEIAETLGVTPQNISDIRNSPLFQRELQVMQLARNATTIEVSAHIEKIASEGLKLLDDVAKGRGEGINAELELRVKVIQDMLDRCPKTAKVNKIQGATKSYLVTPELIERLHARRVEAEAVRSNNPIEEADFEDIEREA